MDPLNPQAAHEAIKHALFAGQKIMAIKLYREQNHVGLAEAKAAVEKMEAELGIAAVPPAQARYFVMLLMLGLIVVAGFLVWKLLASSHGHPSP